MRRVALTVLTVLSALFLLWQLADSWTRPQEQSRLDLLQVDLVVQAATGKTQDADSARSLLFGNEPQKIYNQALQSYRNTRDVNARVLSELNRIAPDSTELRMALSRDRRRSKQRLVGELDLRIGLLQVAATGNAKQAIATWETVIQSERDRPSSISLTARILQGLWSDPIAILPDAEATLNQNLDRWFRVTALEKLYELQQRQKQLAELTIEAQTESREALQRLLVVNAVPLVGGSLGVVLWLVLGVQFLIMRSRSLLAETPVLPSPIPWIAATILEVMVLWFTAFLLVGQLLVPIFLQIVTRLLTVMEVVPEGLWSYRYRALLVLLPYVFSMMPMLVIIGECTRDFKPLPEGWLKLRLTPPTWIAWGVGGYFAALPLVLLVSFLNEQIWDGKGGGNPLLSILLESRDGIARLILWTTLAIAAPFFEEYLFRGFLFTSLRKYLPLVPALSLSGFCFAIAHLNLSDVLPLTMLGIVLGFVYSRSGNLLAPMLLHCLWNTGSFVALLALSGK